MKLERRHRLALLLILCLAWCAWQSNHMPTPDPALSVKARTLPEKAPQDLGAYEEERRSGLEALTRMEDEKEKRDLAASKSLDARAKLLADCQDSWAKVMATNQPAFLDLREKAKHSPLEETPCTLCDGKGNMHFCLVCPKNRGVCQACSGLGHNGYGDLCPACLGKRKCFNCFGSGKMLCPFCNDGTISAKGPLPPARMPAR